MPLYYVEAQIQEEVVELQVSFGDNSGTHNPRPKAPAQKPTIVQEGYKLSFITPCDNYVFHMLNENQEVVYSIIIPSGCNSLVLPSYLSGEYRIEIQRGRFCFWGFIEL